MTSKPRSGNPAKRPTSVTAWKKSAQVAPIQLPSGNWMSFRRVGLQALLGMGMMPNSLMAVAQKAVAKGEGKEPGIGDAEMLQLLADPEKVAQIGKFMDDMICFVAVEPPVNKLPLDGVDRDPELLYIDEVDEEDKMFIFQVVTGGTTEVESFRQEHGASMAALRGREDVELPAE